MPKLFFLEHRMPSPTSITKIPTWLWWGTTYCNFRFAAGDLLSEVRTQFEGPMTLAEDFVSLNID